MSSHRKRLVDDVSSRSNSGKRHHQHSSLSSPSRPATPPPDTRRPSFPSYLDIPNLPSKIRLLCEILASSPSIESSLNDSGILISSDDVEEVLKLSYSHPAAAVKFFRWCGPRLHHEHSPYSWNLVVDLLGKNLLFDAMWDAVASMKSEGLVSLATFASIFSSFAAASRPADAIASFESLPIHGIPQDTTALNSLLSALSREGLTYAALDAFRRICIRISPDSDSYAILLEGFENERNYPSAREVFDEMIRRVGWDPCNVPAYDSFLNTILSRGISGLDESLMLLAKMEEQRCFPGMKFIVNAINECVKLTDVRTAIFLWDSLIGRNGCLPTTELYNSMITLYCNLNQLDAAYRFFDDMVFYGAFPDSRTYNLMLQLLIKNKKLQGVLVLLNEMVKNEFVPSSAICDSAMNLLMDSRDWETALKVWKIMTENGIAGEQIGNSLILCLRDYKLLPEACKYAEDMIEKGIKLHSSTLSKLRSSLQQSDQQHCAGAKGAFSDREIMRKRKTPASRAKAGRQRPPAASAAGVAAAARMKRSIPAGDLSLHLERMPSFPLYQLSAPPPPPPSRFQRKLLEVSDSFDALSSLDDGREEVAGDNDCILSQDFFCTPDYITPEILNNFNPNKENIACPKSPEKSTRNKRHKQVCSPCILPSSNVQLHEEDVELKFDEFGSDKDDESKSVGPGFEKKQRYVSKSAVALRCRVMPPPCIKNPYLIENSSIALDIFGDRLAKFAGFSPSIGGDGLSRYHTDFHELEQIGSGNFSHVFKALKRIDGCLYAVKHSIKQFHNDMERRYALREVQALAALGHHANIVGYHTSWFENDKLYIQMELCDHSLSKGYMPRSGDVLEILFQMATALNYMHERGIAHMDVKPENIYVKHGVYKLGDFGCAILTDKTLPIEEGDSRYMPQEILNDKYEHLDKVDIFSLGAAIYELVKASPLPESGPLFCNLREGKIPLLPGYSMQFQNVLKAMMDPDPVKRPSAREIMENPIFERAKKTS